MRILVSLAQPQKAIYIFQLLTMVMTLSLPPLLLRLYLHLAILPLICEGINEELPGYYQYDLLENDYTSPLPYTYIRAEDLPRSFSWDNVDGKSYLTRMRNQHIPQYCGSCWAHSSTSALADRMQIASAGTKTEMTLSVQFLLNCGNAGSCHGGSATRAYQFIKNEAGFIPYDTCQPYIACSSDSTFGFCPHVDASCSAINTCRTCSPNGTCTAIASPFPNATIAEYGTYTFHNDSSSSSSNENSIREESSENKSRDEDPVHVIMAEIYARGPLKASVHVGPTLLNYKGGVLLERDDPDEMHNTTHNHGISLVGWGSTNHDDNDAIQYWIVRNSWGEYWGEMGFFRIELGKNLLGVESHLAWATPGTFTVGGGTSNSHQYVDPSKRIRQIQQRLKRSSSKLSFAANAVASGRSSGSKFDRRNAVAA